MTITIQARTRRADTRGAPLRIRISHQGERCYYSIGIRVPVRNWDPEKERARRSHPDAARINARIARVQEAAERAMVEVQTSGQPVTAEAVRDAMRRRLEGPDTEEVMLCAYAEERFRRHYDKRSTLEAQMNGIRKFRSYWGGDIPLGDLTERVLREYRQYIVTDLGHAGTTADKDVSTLRTAWKMAMREGLVEHYPFEHLSLNTSARRQKEPLTPEEVARLEALREELPPYDVAAETTDAKDDTAHQQRLRLTLDIWLWSLYLMGMRLSDVVTLRWSSIQGDRCRYTMRKTGADKDVLIVQKARRILRAYEQSGTYVYPLILLYDTPDLDLRDRDDETLAVKRASSRLWRHMREIQARAQIDTHLSMHVARHTFAARAMESGWTLQEIQAALGHGSVSTTERYLRSLRDDELDEQHEALF